MINLKGDKIFGSGSIWSIYYTCKLHVSASVLGCFAVVTEAALPYGTGSSAEF